MKFPSVCLAFFVLAVSCKQNREIKVYKVAKESAAGSGQSSSGDPHAGVPGVMPGGVIPGGAAGADPHAGLSAEQLAAAGAVMPSIPQFSDAPPPHWKKLPPSAMLLMKYQIEGEGGASVEVTFSTLRSAPGGLLANINRWRGQLGQPPFEDATLKENTSTVPSGFGDAVLVDIEGLAPGADAAKDGRLIGAIAEQGPNAWFFKLRGNPDLAAAEKENFIAWIQTVKPDASAPAVPVAPAAEAPVPAGDGSVSWQLPEGWKVVSGSSARYATLQVSGADGSTGELAISHFPGDVGGDLANVNRWRQQLSLPPIAESGLAPLITKVTAGPETFSLVDVKGPQNRLASAWTRHGPDTWFFKFTGPDAVVGAEKANFTAFLESVRFNTPE
jgi:hypothetical protein